MKPKWVFTFSQLGSFGIAERNRWKELSVLFGFGALVKVLFYPCFLKNKYIILKTSKILM